MCNKKTNNKIFIVAVLIIALLLSTIALVVPKTNLHNKNLQLNNDTSYEDKIANLTEGTYSFTNNEIVNGINIDEYVNYYAKNASVKYSAAKVKYVMSVYGNDDIVNFIPEDLFKTTGFKQHFGKKYGFVVSTSERLNCQALISSVMLVKITTSDVYDSTSHLKIRVEPIFQADFAYVNKSITKMVAIEYQSKDIFVNNYLDKVIMDYQCDGEEFIVPVPTDALGLNMEFKQHNKLRLSNPTNMVSLYNVNGLNPWDNGFDPYKDKGAFFSQIDFAYEGKYLVPTQSDYADIGELSVNMISTTFDALDLLHAIDNLKELKYLKSVFKAMPYVGVAFSTIDIIADIAKLTSKAKFEEIGKEKKFSYKAFFNNKEQQIQNGGLQKDATIAIKINEPGKQFLVGTGDFFEFDYQINTQDPNVDMVYASMFVCDVYQANTAGSLNNKSETILLGNVASVFSNELINNKDKNYKEVPAIDIDQTYLDYETINILPNRESVIKITPKFTGKFDLTMSENPYAKFKVYRVLKAAVIGKDYRFGSVYASSVMKNNCAVIENLNLNNNFSYIIVADLQNNSANDKISTRYDILNLNIKFLANEIHYGSNNLELENKEEIIAFNCKYNMYYYFDFNKEQFESIFLLNNEYDIVQDCLLSDEIKVSSNYGSKVIFFKVVFKDNVDRTIDVSIRDEMNVIFTNADNTINEFDKQIIINTQDEFSLPQPIKNGYVFEGWIMNNGNPDIIINNQNIFHFARPDLELIAIWSVIEYDITFVTNGGTSIDSVKYNIKYSFDLNGLTPTKDSYHFAGWYDNPQFSGSRINVLKAGNYGDRTYYAKWIKNQLQLELDVNKAAVDGVDVKINQTDFVVNYGKSYTLPVPYADGFIFEGWYYGNKKLTNAYGISLQVFEEDSDITLTAHWAREVFYFRINKNNGTYVWLTQIGDEFVVMPNKVGIEFSVGMCPNCFIIGQLALKNENSELIRQRLFREGKYFTHMSTANSKESFCWKDINALSLFDRDKTFALYPQYNTEKYRIVISKDKVSQEEFVFEYGQNLYENGVFLPQVTTIFDDKNGYYVDGYEVADVIENYKYNGSHFAIGSVFNYKQMPDLSNQFFTYDDIYSIYLTAHYSPKHYVVNFENVVDELEPIEVEFGGIYTYNKALPVPLKNGYIFAGWCVSENGEPISNNLGYIEQWNIASDCTLYAKWDIAEFTITLDANSGSVDQTKIKYNIEMETFKLPIAYKSWYTFMGWKYGNQTITELETGTYGDIVLVAVWDKEKVNAIIFGENIIDRNGLIIDISLSGSLISQSFIIEDTVSEITFTGRLLPMSYKTIKIKPRTKDLSIKLKQFNVYGNYNGSVIDASECHTLNLIVDGKNFLGSGNKFLTTIDSIKAAIMCQNINISGTNNGELELLGGAGFGLVDNKHGLSGSSGIYGTGSTMRISNVKLTATGGNGYGGYVDNNGGIGGNGGNGGHGIYFYGRIIVNDSSKVVAKAGNGGNAGSRGRPGSPGSPVIASDGVSGTIERIYGDSGSYSLNSYDFVENEIQLDTNIA